jgi:hypothetical protein
MKTKKLMITGLLVSIIVSLLACQSGYELEGYSERQPQTIADNRLDGVFSDLIQPTDPDFKDDSVQCTFNGTNKFSLLHTWLESTSKGYVKDGILYSFEFEINPGFTQYRYRLWWSPDFNEEWNPWSEWLPYSFSGNTLTIVTKEGIRILTKVE